MKPTEGSQSSKRHKEIAATRGPVFVALLTVSDSRTVKTDVNSRYLREELRKLGHEVADYRVVKDDPEQVLSNLKEMVSGPAQFLLINGGTGISPRDTTFDVLDRLLEKPLPGFGELFRMLSYQKIGSAAMISRATAGVYRNCIVFLTPGSPHAVRLAWKYLISPELLHLAYEIGKGKKY